MTDSPSSAPPRELRIKGGERLRALVGRFSATERVIFLALVAVALASSLLLAYRASQLFMVTVPAAGGALAEGEVGVIRTADPILASSDSDKDLVALTYAGLMRRDASGDLVPDLAQSYAVSPDGLTYTFMLKPNLRFDDGQPITAEDVVFTMEKAQDPNLKSPDRADWANVTATAVSDGEVQFTLKEPYAPFLADATIGILPEHVWKGVSDDEFPFSAYNVDPVGDGPYKVASVGKDSDGVPTSIALVPNGNYPGQRPYLGKIVLDFYPDEEHAVDALRSGGIESLGGIDPADAALLASSSATSILTAPVPREFGVFFNQSQNPVFADAAVRKALSVAADRGALVQTVLDGYGVPIFSPLPKEGVATSSAAEADIALATSTLEKDGWKLGSDGVYSKTVNKKPEALSFAISTADSPDLKAAATALAAEWRAAGADVAVNVFEYGDLATMVSQRSYDALLFGQYVSDPLDLYAFWDSSQRNAPGLNVAGYVSAKADRNLEAARAATSSAVQEADLDAFAAAFAQDNPAVLLYSPDYIYAVPRSLRGADISAVSSPSDRFDGVANWYVNTDRVWAFFKNFSL